MFETTEIANEQNLLEVNVDFSSNEAYGFEATQTNSSSAGYTEGTINADIFAIDPNFQINVFSGNGNIDYGYGFYDTIDLSHISIDQVVDVSLATIEEGGTIINVGDGDRVFDYITLADGTEILFEGIELIAFSDDVVDLTVNPNDPGFAQQWNLHTMGLQTAWNFTTGTDEILIGVQDSGLGTDFYGNLHPDLRLDETFVFGDSNVVDEFINGGQPVTDSHGTAVQGIIAADSNNGVGIAGINWNSDVFNIDVLGDDAGDLDLTQATQAMIDQAASQGQKLIINMSLGGGSLPPGFEALVANNQDDVLFVIATGNDGASQISSPSIFAQQYDNVVAVGASEGYFNSAGEIITPGTIAEYSNGGQGITLVGPTAVPTTSATYDGLLDYNLGFDGTSAATPNVAGVASLVWSANSDLDATDIKAILANTATDLGAQGYDLVYGSGMVNADAAVRQAIALGRNTTSNVNGNSLNPPIDTDSNIASFNFSATESVTASTVASSDLDNSDSQEDMTESNLIQLPTSLFDYQAAGLEDVVELSGQMIKDDLFSSPLYAA